MMFRLSGQMSVLNCGICFILNIGIPFLGRGQLYKILKTSARLGKEYDKSDKQIYDALLDKQDTAIANSQRLHDSALRDKPHFPWRVNPSTNVHEIVEQLNNLAAVNRIGHFSIATCL